ncbi:hypothetical protein SKAU_G00024900 [Synaphobranchus kaupii]|uniref:Uncharacterized protein n=1 Tax=Synaphobranchus kaupii TaxID=118154 RepID=A0A9Q1GD32_SYNKA|nr:hypothetical protein SKAU_G00024900 [Synaphobranchus kaupii]
MGTTGRAGRRVTTAGERRVPVSAPLVVHRPPLNGHKALSGSYRYLRRAVLLPHGWPLRGLGTSQLNAFLSLSIRSSVLPVPFTVASPCEAALSIRAVYGAVSRGSAGSETPPAPAPRAPGCAPGRHF